MKAIITFLMLVACTFSQAQNIATQHTAAGKVIDKATREPLELAVVYDLVTGKKLLTDRQGHFAPLKVSGDSLWIEVSFIGYRSRQIGVRAGNANAVIELEKSVLDMTTVTITGNSGAGVFHTLSQIDLDRQPARSAQDLLRLVPGLFIAQHQGGGKAEQIFLRGFDADHGTDVNVSVDGMPVNLVSNSHGQGYADLHFLIPETVANYDFGKGPYYANQGDFTTAGYVGYNTMNVPDKNIIKVEGGPFNTGRVMAMINLLSRQAKDSGQSAYIAAEGLYSDGPFDYPEHFHLANLFGKFITPLYPDNKLIVTLSTLSSAWRASGEIPNRAVSEGYIKDRFGVLDSAQGGYTSRTNANIRILSHLPHNFTLENQA